LGLKKESSGAKRKKMGFMAQSLFFYIRPGLNRLVFGAIKKTDLKIG